MCKTSGGVEIKPGMMLYAFRPDEGIKEVQVKEVRKRSFKDMEDKTRIGFMWQSSKSSALAYFRGDD